ncbi:MAG: hypothetical protein WC260_00700 [Candidatus Pacearchaeota archaeon]
MGEKNIPNSLDRNLNELELILTDSMILSENQKKDNSYVECKTLTGNIYKAKVDFSEIYPLLLEQQYYLDFN